MEESQPQIRTMKDIFERIKTLHGLKKDEEIWKLLGLSRGFYQEVKAGRKFVSNEAGLRIASKASLPEDGVLVFIQREKANSEHEAALWDGLLSTTSHNG